MEYLIYVRDKESENINDKYDIIDQEKLGEIEHIIRSRKLKNSEYVKIIFKNSTIKKVY